MNEVNQKINIYQNLDYFKSSLQCDKKNDAFFIDISIKKYKNIYKLII